MANKKRGVKEKTRVPPGEDRIATPIPAPGGLAVVQAFMNTFDAKAKKDELRTPRHLADLLSRQGLLPAGTQLTAADLERARSVRHGLRSLAWANGGRKLNAEAVARLDQGAAGARAQVRFDADGTSRLEPVSRDFDDALGTLLGYVHEARCEGRWKSFKLCSNGECHRAFFDFTKSCSGKWCTRRCGEKIRARASRRRAAKYRDYYY